MKNEQFSADDIDLAGWDEEEISEANENNESKDEKADDVKDDTTSEDDEKLANGSQDQEKETEDNSEEAPSDSKDNADTKEPEKDTGDDKSSSKEDKKAEEEDEDDSDLLADIIENGSDAIDKIVERKLAEKEAIVQEEASREQEVQESQTRFTNQANKLMEEVADFSDVVNDDLYAKALENPQVALAIFESADNAKSAYVYGKTGIVYADDAVMLEQFDALVKLSPQNGKNGSSGVPPQTSGGAYGETSTAYSDVDEVGWE